MDSSNAEAIDTFPAGHPTASPILTLTQDQLNELLSSIRIKNIPENDEPRAPPQQTKRKPSRWPEWDGAQNTYSVYIDMMNTKIEDDWEFLEGHRTVCNEMMNTIPTDCRLRVPHWLLCGGPKNNWDYKNFIEHFNDNFENKTSARSATFSLTKMKQGKSQPFSDYLRDSESTLAQAKGLNWEDCIKIIDLYGGLNDRITRALYPIEVSEDDYTHFLNQVRGVACRIEAHEDRSLGYPSDSSGSIDDEYYKELRNSSVKYRDSPRTSREDNTTILDADGDTPLSGLNGMSIENLAALVNAVNIKNNPQKTNKSGKPSAPWRSPEDFNALRRWQVYSMWEKGALVQRMSTFYLAEAKG